ncbi:MAG: hypothetical protein HUU18_09865 [Phycisphaerales bacterium]|nr:hypothetical protein [Phycisphaerales bacterium]
MRSSVTALLLGASVVLALSPAAHAQLREADVLVVYDSRVPDSLSVAEYYAGSAKVPGGAGNQPGKRPGVRVFNLASSGAPVAAPGNISWTDFVARLRDPIRAHLNATNTVTQVRCLVTTKGLPHRLLDTDFPAAGDNPGNFIGELNLEDATCASVDAELALLWQDLIAGENGNAADSKADGLIINPYWRSALPITAFSNASIQTPKTFTYAAFGPLWSLGGSGATRLTAGDMLLVARLDAPSVADVRAMIDRAWNIYANVDTAALLLDESDSNAIADGAGNDELDNNNGAWAALRAADDYETTRDQIAADGRWLPAMVRYNALAGVGQFFVGPNLAFAGGHGILVTNPVLLVGTYGANHNGVPALAAGGSSNTTYALSYNLAPGAIFNTIESYNGRDFAGLGQNPWVQQQQLSAFLAAGGTLGIGNVWEPLADSVPDNQYLVSNFLLGNLAWGEAAWTSIPALSWMQMVVGDPLARVTRSSEDINADLRLSIDDLYAWEQLGPTAPRKDVNRSGTADATDRAHVIRSLRAHERDDLMNRRP